MDNENQPKSPGRRNIIKLLAVGAAVYAPFVWTRSRTTPKEQIVVRDPGGLISELYREVFYDPFEHKTGIKVIGALSKPEPIAQIRMMVEQSNYSWDIANLNHRSVLLLTTGNNIYLEEHRLKHDPIISGIAPQFLSPYGVGTNVYTTVLTYRTDVFKNCRSPQSWQDFGDVNNFPGRRSLRNLPFETIEIALMAAGVSLDKIYPCDLNKALESLSKIEPYIPVWWTTGAQSEHFLNSGEADLMSAFISKVQKAIKDGKPLAFSWDQHIYAYENWTILKGTPKANACREFIKFASDPKRQAKLAPYAIGPTHTDAFKYIDKKQTKLLPTYPDNLKKGLFIDASYWLEHQNIVFDRFNEWKLGSVNA
ncbi:ABC transporter substrate-binding protein [Mycoavidus sp. HKI]|uniref:ABC transporter substrate-binding protein n=1 Tax=Mycoavidus sp. HKI TaxID=2840467 RepID=UPI001CBC2074|nr:ABC transporter substrate-binding protein [Mycoavidus sp. HKI]UAW63673.1 ABC transporter substrate-binding protein [Mycoavidus sp. HKI]